MAAECRRNLLRDSDLALILLNTNKLWRKRNHLQVNQRWLVTVVSLGQ